MEPAPDITEETLQWPQIVSKAVHDMRTPLSAMRTTLEILRMISAGSDQQVRLVGIIDKQVDELTGYLETLLEHPGAFQHSSQAAE